MRPKTIVTAFGALAMAAATSLSASAESAGSHSGQRYTQNTGAFRDTVNGRPLEDAPVPGIRRPGVSPADRAGSTIAPSADSGPVNSTPFSGTPDTDRSGGGQADRIDPAAGNAPMTPNLGR